jgi:hypothetical protein
MPINQNDDGLITIISTDHVVTITEPVNKVNITSPSPNIVLDSVGQTVSVVTPQPLVVIDSDKEGQNPYFDTSPALTIIAGIAGLRGFVKVDLSWVELNVTSHHSHVEVWRSQINNVSSAICVGESRTQSFTDPVDPGKTYFYWFRGVTYVGNKTDYFGNFEVAHSSFTLSGSITALLAEVYAAITQLEQFLLQNTANAIEDLDTKLTNNISSEVTTLTQLIHLKHDELVASLLLLDNSLRASDVINYNNLHSQILVVISSVSTVITSVNNLTTSSIDGDALLSARIDLISADYVTLAAEITALAITLHAKIDAETAARNADVAALYAAQSSISNELTAAILLLNGNISAQFENSTASINTVNVAYADLNSALASTTTTLTASIESERLSRFAQVETVNLAYVTLNSALASTTETLTARVNSEAATRAASVLTTNQAYADLNGALASTTLNLNASVETAESSMIARVVNETQARVAENLVLASDTSLLSARMTTETTLREAAINTERVARVTNESSTASLVETISAGISNSELTINSRISDSATAFADSTTALASRVQLAEASIETAEGALIAQTGLIQNVTVSLEGTAQAVTALQSNITTGDGSSATAIARFTVIENNVTGLSARAEFGVDVNGHFTGIDVQNGETTIGSITFTAEQFSLFDPALNNNQGGSALFYVNGQWEFRGKLRLSDDTLLNSADDLVPAPFGFSYDPSTGQHTISNGVDADIVLSNGTTPTITTSLTDPDNVVITINGVEHTFPKGYVPVLGFDYNDGNTGDYVSTVFKQTNLTDNAPSKPTDGSYDGTTEVTPTLPDVWTDDRMEILNTKVRWVSSRRYTQELTYTDGVANLPTWSAVGDWSSPVKDALPGPQGASAFQIWSAANNGQDISVFLDSLNAEDGIDGNTWYSETGNSATWAIGIVGDFILSDGSNIYKKTVSVYFPTDSVNHEWVFVKNLIGPSAKSLVLSSSAGAFSYKADGTLISPTSIIFSAQSSGLIGNTTWKKDGITLDGVVGLSYTLTSATFNSADSTVISVEQENLSDATTIHKLQDGLEGSSPFQIILSNSVHSIPTLQDGTDGVYTGSETTVKVFEGTTLLNYDTSGEKGTWTASLLNSGTAGASSLTFHADTPIAPDITNLVGNSGIRIITVTGIALDGTTPINLSAVQSFSKNKQGISGNSITVQYSADDATDYDADWHTEFTPATDKYMRQRVGTESWSTAIQIVGEGGNTGNYTDYQFALSALRPTTTPTSASTEWTDSPSDSSLTQFVWMIKAQKNHKGEVQGSWSVPIRLTGERGEPGVSPDPITPEPGDVGPGGAGWFVTISDATANERLLVLGDIADNGGNPVRWNGEEWVEQIAFISGSLLVDGAITARTVSAGTIGAAEINVDNLFAEEIDVTGSLTVGNSSGVHARLTAGNNNQPLFRAQGVNASGTNVPLFEVKPNGQGVVNGNWLTSNSLLGKAISQNAIDFIRSQLGLDNNVSETYGGKRDRSFNLSTAGTFSLDSFNHGSNDVTVAISLSGQADFALDDNIPTVRIKISNGVNEIYNQLHTGSNTIIALGRYGEPPEYRQDIEAEILFTDSSLEPGERIYSVTFSPLTFMQELVTTVDFSIAEVVTHSGGSGSGSSYVLPTASADVIGGVKVGSGLVISEGVLSSNGIVSGETQSIEGSIVQRDIDRDISARLFRSEFTVTNPVINYIVTQQLIGTSNNYMRPSTPAQFRQQVTDNYYPKLLNTNSWEGVNTFTKSSYFKDAYIGNGTSGNFYSDVPGRTAFTGGHFYIQSGCTNYYNYAANQYHGNTYGTNHYFRGNYLSGNKWSISNSGLFSGTDATATSDIRYKVNLAPINKALDKVCQLSGKTYDHLEKQGERSVGHIAQEVEVVLPEAIYEVPDKRLGLKKVISLSAIPALHTEAIKELKRENDSLKERLSRIEATLTHLTDKK